MPKPLSRSGWREGTGITKAQKLMGWFEASDLMTTDEAQKNYYSVLHGVLNHLVAKDWSNEMRNGVYDQFILLGTFLYKKDRNNFQTIQFFKQVADLILNENIPQEIRPKVSSMREKIIETQTTSAPLADLCLLDDNFQTAVIRKMEGDQKQIAELQRENQALRAQLESPDAKSASSNSQAPSAPQPAAPANQDSSASRKHPRDGKPEDEPVEEQPPAKRLKTSHLFQPPADANSSSSSAAAFNNNARSDGPGPNNPM